MSSRFDCSAKLAFVAGLIAMCVLAPGQPSSQLVRELQAAKRNVMHARVSATIRTTNGDGTTLTHWAWSEGKEHSVDVLRLGPGESESVWDGKRGMNRYTPTDLPAAAPPESPWVNVTKAARPSYLGALEAGYFLFLRAPLSTSWVVDIARIPGVKSESTNDGLVRLRVPSNLGGKRIIELNPRWGYMIQIDRDFEETRQRSRTGVISGAMRTEEVRIREAKKIGGIWIPTKWESRNVEAYGPRVNYSSQSVSELTDISTNVPESEFAPLGRPGDKVSDGKKHYVIDPAGKWKLDPLAKPQPRYNPQLNVKPILPDAHPPTLRILAVAGALMVCVEVVLLIRRSRRRPTNHWGPPGPKA